MPVVSPKRAFWRGAAVVAGLTSPMVLGAFAVGVFEGLLMTVGVLSGAVKVGAFAAAVAWVSRRRRPPPAPPAPLAACARGAVVGAIVLAIGYVCWNPSEEPSRLALGVLIAVLTGGVTSGALWAVTAWIMRPLGRAAAHDTIRSLPDARTP